MSEMKKDRLLQLDEEVTLLLLEKKIENDEDEFFESIE